MKIVSIWKRIIIVGLVFIALMGTALYLVGRNNLQFHPYHEAFHEQTPKYVTEPLTENVVVRQSFVSEVDEIRGVSTQFATYGYSFTEGNVELELVDSQGNVLGCDTVEASRIINYEDVYFHFNVPISLKQGEEYYIQITSSVGLEGNYLTAWMGDFISGTSLSVNGQPMSYSLYMDLDSYRNAHFFKRFWIVQLSFIIILLSICSIGIYNDSKKKVTASGEFVHIFDQYSFLLFKLVGRDFAVKYRRSYLGFLWVILNPLLTMIVMSTVFAYIFRLQIQNYAVYLILGNIVFNCFAEATQISALSIVGSGQMIKKVYIPKYIFPLSKTMFSFFNFILTFIPAMIVIFYYKVPITINYVLLPYVIVGLFMFALGVGLFLAALQVFMRDTQYLYGILLTLWTYLTPLFYSEDSLAPQLRRLMQFNPMYIYINSVRKIMLYGMTPTVFQLGLCIWMGVLSLCIGLKYFHSKQKNFILHI